MAKQYTLLQLLAAATSRYRHYASCITAPRAILICKHHYSLKTVRARNSTKCSDITHFSKWLKQCGVTEKQSSETCNLLSNLWTYVLRRRCWDGKVKVVSSQFVRTPLTAKSADNNVNNIRMVIRSMPITWNCLAHSHRSVPDKTP